MKNQDKEVASRMLVTFVRNFTDLIEKQLSASRQTMREAVDGIMEEVQAISSRTAENKDKANTVLLKTYTNPDAAEKKVLDEVQDEVTRIFEEAQKSGGKDDFKKVVVQKDAAPTPTGTESNLSRTVGLFSKHMEALDVLDSELGNHLMKMMGLLSRDDVVQQRLDHVVLALQALQTSLSYLLVDYDNRAETKDIERFIRDLKAYVYNTYTMEEEKVLFNDVFSDSRKAS